MEGNPRIKPLIIYPSRQKLVLLLLAAAAFVAGGAYMTVSGFTEVDSHGIYGVIGIVAMLFFGLCGLYLVYRLFKRRPALVIDDKGITDNSSYIGGGHLRWEEVRTMMVFTYLGQYYFGLSLQDPEGFLARQRGLKRILMKANKRLLETQVNIPQTMVQMPLDELAHIAEEHWKRRMSSL